MKPAKWMFTLEWYSGMNYYCIASSFEGALAKARKQARKLKEEENLKRTPSVISIERDGGDYVE